MNPVTKAISILKEFEGCKLKAYQDQKGVWTIGYGSTGLGIGRDVVWTQEQADKMLTDHVEAIYGILRRIIMPALSEQQWAALISMAYNIGVTALSCSTLIRLINERDFKEAADEFPKWDKITVAGKVIVNQGLLNRRMKERELFLSGII